MGSWDRLVLHVTMIDRWVAERLSSITLVLLALWVPPVIFTLAVDTGLTPYRSGYLRPTDPSLLLEIVELTAMIVAVAPLRRRDRWGWSLLVWSRAAVAAQTLWHIATGARLTSIRTELATRSTVEALAGLAVAVVLLARVRCFYSPPISSAPPTTPLAEPTSR